MKLYFKPLKRREFLKKSVVGGMAVASLPLWKHFSYAIPAYNVFEHSPFNLDKETLERLLKVALENGGDFSEIYIEHNVQNEVWLSENRISSAVRGVDAGVGIRVLKGGKTGYAHSGDFSLEALTDTARVAGLIAAGKAKQKVTSIQKGKTPNYYMVKTLPDDVLPQQKAKLLMKANELTYGLDKRIEEVGAGFIDNNKRITVANSEGVWASDFQVLSNFFVRVHILKNGKRARGFSSKTGTLGFEHFNIDLGKKLAKKALHSAIVQLEAEDAPAGQFPAVFEKENSGVFFHEAIGHSLEADGIRKKTSAFWDKKGKQIASNIVSLADDGTVPGGRGSINVDDEGTPGQNTILIKNGTCTSFLFDKLNAKLMNTKSTGNGRRESYKFYPLPRMTNTYLLPGKDDPEDILKSVKYGIFVADIGGGNVDPTTGRFVFQVTFTLYRRADSESYKNIFSTPLSIMVFILVNFPSPSNGVEAMCRGNVGLSTRVMSFEAMGFR